MGLPQQDNHYSFRGDVFYSESETHALDAEVRLFIWANNSIDTLGVDYVEGANTFDIQLSAAELIATMEQYDTRTLTIQGKYHYSDNPNGTAMIKQYLYTLEELSWWEALWGDEQAIHEVPAIYFIGSPVVANVGGG